MKRLFEKVLRIAKENQKTHAMLDKKIIARWKVHYSDFDLDEIIDALDYGTGTLSYERFCQLMDEIALAKRVKV